MGKEFWKETLDDAAVIVNGRCYHIGDEDEAQAYADKLNAGIDPEAEEEAETETIEDTGAPLEPYIDDDEEGDEP